MKPGIVKLTCIRLPNGRSQRAGLCRSRPIRSKFSRSSSKDDDETGRPISAKQADGAQLHLWIDIDEAPRSRMLKSLVNRREQMISDGVQLMDDQDHWNARNRDEEPIQLPMDLGPDIEWRRNAPVEEDDAA
jgi:hypothetical protein